MVKEDDDDDEMNDDRIIIKNIYNNIMNEDEE